MDNSESKNMQRQNTSRDNENDIKKEIEKLLRKSETISHHDMSNLKNKYGNDAIVEQIEKGYIEKYTEISKRAKKFAKLIREKYADNKYPFHILLEKAYKYKQKYGLSDAEFSEFQRRYESELVGLKSNDVIAPNTNITKLLGNVNNLNLNSFSNKLNDHDYKILQEIIKLHATSKPLHSQIVLQSMQYEDCSYEALTGKYDRNFHNVSNYVHPVIAALFLPKINILDNHFLLSNISNIVKTRYNNEQFTTIPDMQLYYSLSTDPNDIVCDSISTMSDLHNRAQLQNQLWNSVLSLRNGQYYNNSFREFINAVDLCKLNKYDNPDLIYGRNDGTILKRLLSAFSFRPTIVTTSPIYQIFNTNPYQQNVSPVVTYVHMINLKLPTSLTDNTPVYLKDALEQNQLFIENGNIVPKHTALIYSRGVLIFYVDRRANIINLSESMNPYSMPKIPLGIAGFERLNDREVHFDTTFKIREDIYNLRSVVLSEVNKTPASAKLNLIVGSSSAFIQHKDPKKGRYTNECFLYDPYAVTQTTLTSGVVKKIDPIVQISETPTLSTPNISFIEMARKRGIIFIYELKQVKDDIQLAY